MHTLFLPARALIGLLLLAAPVTAVLSVEPPSADKLTDAVLAMVATHNSRGGAGLEKAVQACYENPEQAALSCLYRDIAARHVGRNDKAVSGYFADAAFAARSAPLLAGFGLDGQAAQDYLAATARTVGLMADSAPPPFDQALPTGTDTPNASFSYTKAGAAGTMKLYEVSGCSINGELGCMSEHLLMVIIASTDHGHTCKLAALENATARISHDDTVEALFDSQGADEGKAGFAVRFEANQATVRKTEQRDAAYGCEAGASILGVWKKDP